MKIGTKIATGYGILLVFLLSVQVYQISLISQMAGRQQQLSRVNFQFSFKAVRLLQNLERLEEFSQKYLITGDDAYGNRLASLGKHFGEAVQEVERLGLNIAKQEEVGRLLVIWKGLRETLLRVGGDSQDGNDNLILSLTSQADRLRSQINLLIDESQREVAAQVARSVVVTERVKWVSRGLAAIGIGLAILACFLVLQSISKPLHKLTAATERIAKGDFSVPIDNPGEDELGQLAVSFNGMMRRLSELDELKRGFVSLVSHELKAPLASIQETTKLLLERVPGNLNKEQERFLYLNLRSGERLSAMIRNLLDLSMIEAGVMQFTFAKTEVAPLLQRAIDEHQGLYLERKLLVETDFPAETVLVECDAERLLQVLSNLLSNAVRFSPEGGTIRVECKSGLASECRAPKDIPRGRRNPEERLCLISMKDQGPGIPDQEKDRVFDKFYGVGQGKRVSGLGTGLGLTISKRIVEEHRGAIWVEDSASGGSVFCVLLPLERQQTSGEVVA